MHTQLVISFVCATLSGAILASEARWNPGTSQPTAFHVALYSFSNDAVQSDASQRLYEHWLVLSSGGVDHKVLPLSFVAESALADPANTPAIWDARLGDKCGVVCFSHNSRIFIAVVKRHDQGWTVLPPSGPPPPTLRADKADDATYGWPQRIQQLGGLLRADVGSVGEKVIDVSFTLLDKRVLSSKIRIDETSSTFSWDG